MLHFRLRTLFIATAVTAALVWIFYVPPQWLGLLAIYLIYALLPAAIVAGIVFHRGYWQAFFVGMAPWAVLVIFCYTVQAFPFVAVSWPFIGDLWSSDPEQLFVDKALLAASIMLEIASGLVGIGIRWWAIKAQGQDRAS